MSLLKKNKDHLRELADAPHAVALVVEAADDESTPLQFWTRHPEKPYLVDLTAFADGESEWKRRGKWAGAFTGRSEFIHQLAPAIREHLLFAPEDTAQSFIKYLRWWWRLFDTIELRAEKVGAPMVRMTGVEDLTELHRQAAIDAGIAQHGLHALRRVADHTRSAMGLRQLHWTGPEKREPKRRLPPPEKISLIWAALKREWLKAVDRWRRAEVLLRGESPADDIEANLLKNYLFLQAAESRLGAFPTSEDLRQGSSRLQFAKYSARTMYEGFYPNPYEARIAFNMCLAGCGWNVQPLLDLQVDITEGATTRTPFLQPHPTDPSRYVLRGYKRRGGSEPLASGDWKTDRSPGAILAEMVKRTWPLRQKLIQELKDARNLHHAAVAAAATKAEINTLTKRINSLEQGVRSPWLYCTFAGSVEYLDKARYRRMATAKDRRPVLEQIVDRINDSMSLIGAAKVPYIVAGDFRDAFAAFVWRTHGGSILHVMKALNYKSLRSTTKYLDNTAVNGESSGIFRTFSDAMWAQVRANDRLDVTLIAKYTQDGGASAAEHERLAEYRRLKLSRVGIGCKDPCNPPASIDPNFQADGIAMCTVQRCTLCLKHAVVMPESLPGLTMRMAELRWLKKNMSADAFIAREYQQEFENAELALSAFDPDATASSVAGWEYKIAAGLHRPVEFQGQIWMRVAA